MMEVTNPVGQLIAFMVLIFLAIFMLAKLYLGLKNGGDDDAAD